nr:N-acetyltransferase [uncultured Roseateles sp.]
MGTLTVRFDSEQGLHADEVFGLEIDALRKAGRKVCEFTKLALEGELPSQQILAALFHMAYIHAYLLRGFDILAVEVNPRHAGYYRRMLGFKVCSPERTNLRVQAPAVLLCVEFEHIRGQIARFGGRPDLVGQVRTLYPMAFAAEEEARLVHQLRAAAGQN